MRILPESTPPRAIRGQLESEMQEIDHRDRDLLNALQSDLPLVSTPFAVVGQLIDMSEKEVLKRTDRLKKEGLVKQISGVFDPRAFGYRSSLVAARVDPERIDGAAGIISGHPGVYQNYRRNHDFNLWFTIAIPPGSRLGLEKTVQILGDEAECQAVRLLPALRSFKHVASEGSDSHEEGNGSPADALSTREIEFVRLLQKDLPLHPRPFEALAKTTSLSGEELLEAARGFAARQQMRRYGALVQARRSSFSASVMGVWNVNPADVDRVAQRMAEHKAVSQCYLRPTYDDWPFNVFTVVHGRSVDECEAILAELSDESGIVEMRALFPVKEYKRTRLSFFSAETEAWEASRSGSQASAVS
ncbi:MAG TPA: AsnC family transcriptional regulator [Thermoanaerobaculia bacterium]|nr:AsnC family transcriptional regulator [Thermoanaerobaculia bacterium]